MNELEKQVTRARRRLIFEQFLNRLVWSLFVGFIVAAVAIAVPKIVPLEQLSGNWASLWMIAGAAGGCLIAIGWTLLSNHKQLDAAMEIDRRFGLRERVASSLSLSPQDRHSDAGQAVITDAMRSLSRIDVRERFHVRMDRRAWLPIAPAAIAFCLMIFVNNREAASSNEAARAEDVTQQVQQSAEDLRKKIARQREELKKRELEDADGLLKEIEEGVKELAAEKEINRKDAMVKLNDLGSQLQKRRQEIGGKEQIERQLSKLKDLEKGPADRAAAAMKQGNWKQAMAEVKQLQKQLADSKLSPEQKDKLKQQLQQMQEKLAAVAEAHRQTMEGLKEQIAKAQQQGDLAKAGELQRQLDQLTQQQPQMNKMQQMAAQMAQAQQALAQGNQQQAAEAMAQLAQHLGQMQQEMEELEMLDAAMAQLDMAKNAMACGQCQGMGCQACQGQGMGMGMNGAFAEKGGMGMGRGRGFGPRPDEEDATNMRDTRVRQTPGRGAVSFGGFAEGGNVRGNIAEEIKEEMARLDAEPAEALTSERLPRPHREHAEQYFRNLRQGP